MIPVLSPQMRQNARRASFAALGVGVLSVAAGAFHMMAARAGVADLKLGIEGRAARLREDRKVANDAPRAAKPAALDRSRAVSCLRSRLTDLATRKGFSIQEFQAGTDESPYMTLYAPDNKDPGWMQAPVRISLAGSSLVLAASLASLRDLEVPFEIDNIEFTRRSTDNSGVAVVSEQIQMRVLFYQGGA